NMQATSCPDTRSRTGSSAVRAEILSTPHGKRLPEALRRSHRWCNRSCLKGSESRSIGALKVWGALPLVEEERDGEHKRDCGSAGGILHPSHQLAGAASSHAEARRYIRHLR